MKSRQKSKSGFDFCSRMCKELAQRIGGTIIPSHYGDVAGKDNYRKLAFDVYPHKCAKCNYSNYIEVLEVHHIDRNRQNSKVENLVILCPTCHREDHFKAKDGIFASKLAIRTGVEPISTSRQLVCATQAHHEPYLG